MNHNNFDYEAGKQHGEELVREEMKAAIEAVRREEHTKREQLVEEMKLEMVGMQVEAFNRGRKSAIEQEANYWTEPGEATTYFTEFAEEIHENAVAHGWWESGERNFGEILMLCVTELAEAMEEHRDGKPNIYFVLEMSDGKGGTYPAIHEDIYKKGDFDDKMKPEGIAVELADCIIRILDYCGHAKINIGEALRIKHAYNKTRPYRHGGKKA